MQGRSLGNVAAERLCGALFVGLTALKGYFYINLGRTQGCPSSARTGSPSAPPGPTPGAVRPWAWAARAGAAARSAPTTHQATVPSPWHPPPWLLFCFLGCLRDGFVRRTKSILISETQSKRQKDIKDIF